MPRRNVAIADRSEEIADAIGKGHENFKGQTAEINAEDGIHHPRSFDDDVEIDALDVVHENEKNQEMHMTVSYLFLHFS